MGTSAKPGQSSTLSRSHSIASAGDKSLILSTVSSTSNASSPPTMHHQSSRHELSNEMLLHELQITKKQLGDALKKNEQTHKDAEFYHAEAESIRTRYNDMLIEKQRSEQEVASLRLFMDEERKEMAEMRRQQQEVLNVDGGEPLSLMYGQLLQNYENVKDEYSLLRKRYDDLAASHSAAVSKLEHSQNFNMETWEILFSNPGLSFIAIDIFKELNLNSLINARLVCKSWNKLIDNTPYLPGPIQEE